MERERKVIPNRLRMYRKNMRYRQKQVARILGLYATTPLSEWEKGMKLPSAKHLLQLSIVYKVHPNELYSEYVQKLGNEIYEREWENFKN